MKEKKNLKFLRGFCMWLKNFGFCFAPHSAIFHSSHDQADLSYLNISFNLIQSEDEAWRYL